MNLDKATSLEDRWLEVFRELTMPEAFLALTFAFDAPFFAGLLDRFADAAGGVDEPEGRAFANTCVDVVCDRSRYKGHTLGYNVTCWPNQARLFHPKVCIALFKSEIVWSDGSLNLTSAGWRRNQEIAMLHRPGSKVLPRELRQLLAALPGVSAAERIVGASAPHSANLPGVYVTSLSEPIGTRFLANAPSTAKEVHMVAPFFELSEAADPPIDDGWLRKLATKYSSARFHIYLPLIQTDPAVVQGDQRLFSNAQRTLDREITFHPVPIADGPLHGKIACAMHTGRGGRRAYMLVGSPNMTKAALLAHPGEGNIETAWILDEKWEEIKPVFRRVRGKAVSIDQLKFEPPKISVVGTWMPIRQAIYDPRKRQLSVAWKDPAYTKRTIVKYNGKVLVVRQGVCQDFGIVNDQAWLTTTHRTDSLPPGFCPIEVPVEVLTMSDDGVVERTPENWLEMLGISSIGGLPAGERVSGMRENRDIRAPDHGAGFAWSKRVRDLTARLRFADERLRNAMSNSVERAQLFNHLQQIYVSHDPSTTKDTHQKVWRIWVRLEIWQMAESLASGDRRLLEARLWRKRANEFRRKLGISSLPRQLQTQFRTAVETLGGDQ